MFKYFIEPPNDLCLYTPASNDLSFLEQTLPKKIGEKWRDGKCKTCSCEFIENKPTSQCTTKQCPKIQDHPDINDFVIEEFVFDYECCPVFQKTACRDGEFIYKVRRPYISFNFLKTYFI